jgi:hypothetical protein
VKLVRSRVDCASPCAGGHSWIATWLRGGGMVIDLPQFNGIGGLQFAIRNLQSQIFLRGLSSVGRAPQWH